MFWAFTVHSPYELASSYDDEEVCDFHYGVDIEVLITPEVMRTNDDLRRVSPVDRGCYFEDEKKLKYFQVYTRRNCEFECYADNLLEEKNVLCAPFYSVRNDSSIVCDIRSLKNIHNFKLVFDADIDGVLTNCQCLEQCDSVKYSIEVFEHKRSDYNVTLDFDEVPTNVSISFRIRDDDVIPRRRYQPWTFIEFLAQSGGLMGLFAGVSALSVIEVFYFVTLRLFLNVIRYFS